MSSRARPLGLIFALSAVALLLVACRGGNDDMPPTAEGTPPPAHATSEVPPGAQLIDQVSLQFVPDQLEVTMGEDVYFKNSERTPHTVRINGEDVAGAMGEGDIVVWTPTQPGIYHVTCDFHRYMEATITVTGD